MLGTGNPCTVLNLRVRQGGQDSNLRPLVPQLSTYFPIRIEFELEGLRREGVGIRIERAWWNPLELRGIHQSGLLPLHGVHG
jgi:hypothetical protein